MFFFGVACDLSTGDLKVALMAEWVIGFCEWIINIIVAGGMRVVWGRTVTVYRTFSLFFSVTHNARNTDQINKEIAI